MKPYTIAFVGNPNVGKSAWINQLAKTNFKVGNWPGVTVEKKEAMLIEGGCCYHLVDLPGTYSLQEYRDEGRITARFLQEHPIDLIVNVCDSMSLKRSLRLTMQLRELQLPMVIVCGYADLAKRKGIEIDCSCLRAVLGADACFLSAHRHDHRDHLWKLIQANLQKPVVYPPIFGSSMEDQLHRIKRQLSLKIKDERLCYQQIYAYFRKEKIEGLPTDAQQWQDHLKMEEVWTRYDEVIDQLMVAAYKQKVAVKGYTIIDRLLLHPLLAYPFCILFFYWFLQMIFYGSTPWSNYIQMITQEYLIPYVRYWLQPFPTMLADFLCDGVISGMSGVISFVPLMGSLYFWIAFLEESGYYARIAFLCDRIMSYFHLSGKAFLALVLGAGCNVPGVIASRSLETQKQRMLTALLVPFISCGARLPIYLLFCTSFFKGKEAAVVASLYGIGLLVAFFCAAILSKTTDFQEDAIQLFELPPYRIPSLRVLGKSAAKECWNYLKKAFSVVLLVMIALWTFSYFPTGDKDESYLAHAAQQASFLFEPLGFGDRWECVAALPGGIVAKESILAYLYPPIENEVRPFDLSDLSDLIDQGIESAKESFFLQRNTQQSQPVLLLWTEKEAALKAYSFLVFVLLSIPCVMTLSAIRTLYGKKILLYSILLMTVFPYVMSCLIYQGVQLVWCLCS